MILLSTSLCTTSCHFSQQKAGLYNYSRSQFCKMDYYDDDLSSARPPSSRSGSRTPRRSGQTPQETVRQFWEDFSTKYPGNVYTVLPDNPYARTKAALTPKGVIQGQGAAKSYEQARRECQRAVKRIVHECERVNQKYTDPHFDIEVDLKTDRRDCLDGVELINEEMRPRGVKRVTVCHDPFIFCLENVNIWVVLGNI